MQQLVLLLQVPDLWVQPTQQKRQPFGDHVPPLHAQTSAGSLHRLPHRHLMRQPSRSRLSVLPCSNLLRSQVYYDLIFDFRLSKPQMGLYIIS